VTGDQVPEILQEAQIDRVPLVADMDNVRPAAGAAHLWREQQVFVGIAEPLADPAGRRADALEVNLWREQLYFMSPFFKANC